ncbi:hypothetical protein DESA109040_01595 [Deinococcus saxicola]
MNRRRDFNRLGYAVQLTVLKHLGLDALWLPESRRQAKSLCS